jgi:hypothetical protein
MAMSEPRAASGFNLGDKQMACNSASERISKVPLPWRTNLSSTLKTVTFTKRSSAHARFRKKMPVYVIVSTQREMVDLKHYPTGQSEA